MSRLIVLLSVLGLYLTSPVLSLSKTQVTILKTLKKKRLKVELTTAQKWEIIEHSKKFPKATQKSLILKFNNEFKTTIPPSTMSDILIPDIIRKLEKLERRNC